MISTSVSLLTQTLGCIGALYFISPKLTGVMCVVIPIIISIGSIMGGGLRKLSKAAQAQVTSVAYSWKTCGKISMFLCVKKSLKKIQFNIIEQSSFKN